MFTAVATCVLLLSGAQGAALQAQSAVVSATGDFKKADALIRAEAPPAKAPVKMVRMDVYYETRCPGCILFINRTLEKLWRDPLFHDVVNVTLFTYGNGMTIPVKDISEGYKFWHEDTTGKGWDNVQVCQHGSDECLGNLVQLCAKDIAEKSQYMDLVFCMSATTIQGYSVEKSTYECMGKSGIDHDLVKECVTTPYGNHLATVAGQQTKALKGRKGTPWVMIDDTHVDDMKALMNVTLLSQHICSRRDGSDKACAPFAIKGVAPEVAKAAAPQGNVGGDFKVLEVTAEKDLLKVSREHV